MDSISLNSTTATVSSNKSLLTASKSNPCPHCGKPDWCYSVGELSVCNRDQPPALGWEETSKTDRDGHKFYAPNQEKKPIRPYQERYFKYPDRDGKPLVIVERIDDGKGKKKIWQKHWDSQSKQWINGLDNIERCNIPPYRYAEVKKAISNGDYVFIADGEQCADTLWELGLAATTSIGGMGKWRESDTQFLEGAKAVICPDRDKPGVEDADKLSKHFPDALWLFAYPESIAWYTLPKSGGLDVKDWIDSQKLSSQDILNAIMTDKTEIEAFRAILMQSRAVESRDTGDSTRKNKSKIKKILDQVETHWGRRLQLNDMTQQSELNGRAEELDIELVYLRLAEELGIDIPKQIASDIVKIIAKKHSYSPVRDYLNSLTNVEPINLDSLAERYFGTADPLHATLLKRTLIAAVARAFKPGCKVDTLCILQGNQGDLKSTFWETLASEPWFTDNLAEGNEKDEKLKLRRYWILEFSEFETAYKRKEVEQLKAFLSSRIDSLRKPYGKAIEDFPRTSIFVGSTNRQEFLHDPTGERRYWVIPVSQKIPIQMLEEERDNIWAAAVAAYKTGEQWWLTPEEDKLLAEANKGWQSSDSWEEDILKYLEIRSTCTVTDILEKPLGIDIGKHGKGEQMRVSDILRRNGWARTSKHIDGKLRRCWEKVVTGVVTEVVTEVVTPQNPLCDSIPNNLLPPVTTSNPNHYPNIESAAGGDKTDNSQPEKSFENGGGNTSPDDTQNLSGQGLQSVTTSQGKGGNTPAFPETHANQRRGSDLADEMREAVAEGDRERAKEIMERYASSVLQVRGFFNQSLTPPEKNAATLLLKYGLTKGTQVEYVGTDLNLKEQYGDMALVIHSHNDHKVPQITCRKPDDTLTTWLRPEDLRKL